ncbi:Ku protein [Desulfosporosinus acidiphilus SJ4]|uniref:Non-homologous end joining protein Ku n=1 Tax=Desulfosporosinus acidiphilus (strain DSM 22704 / JCM 16185 / SJ4) TaxID=646529 RepID=I4D9H6_DESAJ|nr:Ku protein [Desulfosporosinus acidiphilus]AFM42450.1 Ku protein [Desulfosporosinus acidiphilus SJ4]
MHTLWKGSISFGLVNVPVKMHTATESQEFKFNYLHKDCQHRIRSIKKCPNCEKEVEMADLVKGFEYEKDRYVILEDEELAALEQPTSRSIEILDFINLSEIDPIYYDKSYYLSPEEAAQKAYRLLCQAMVESGKVALARVTMRSKQHLACLRVFEEGLVLETMHYPQEIRHMDATWGRIVPTETELSMARQLIDNLARPFEPEKYRDEVHEQVAEMIESKITGESFKVESPVKGGQVVDLMEALRASIALTEQEKEKIETNPDVDNQEAASQSEERKPKSTLTPRKRTARRAKGA